ncbi:MAG: MFS transporter [Acidimicrobiales bacterium]
MTLQRRFLVLTALRWLPTGFLIPVTAVFMLSRGLSIAEVGIAVAVQSAVVLLLELPTGGWADSFGRRRVLLLAGVLDVVALTWFVVSTSLVGFMVAWAIQGVYRALDSGPLEAWFVDESLAAAADADIETGIARSGTAIGAAISTGALGAAALVAIGPLGGVEALALPVLAALVLRVVDLGAKGLLLDEARPPTATGMRGAVREGVRAVLHGRALRALVLVELVWGAGLVGVELLSGPRLVELFGDPEQGVTTLGVTAAIAWSISGPRREPDGSSGGRAPRHGPPSGCGWPRVQRWP